MSRGSRDKCPVHLWILSFIFFSSDKVHEGSTKEGVSNKSLNISTSGVVGRFILLPFPHLGFGLSRNRDNL